MANKCISNIFKLGIDYYKSVASGTGFMEDNFSMDQEMVLVSLGHLLLTSNCAAWFLRGHRLIQGTPVINDSKS